MTISLSQLKGGGGTPIGSFVDFPSNLANTITVDNQTFLKSGVTALASVYPKVPASVTSPLTNLLDYYSNGIVWGTSPGRLASVNNAANTIGLSFFPLFVSSQQRNTYFRTVDGMTQEACRMPYDNSGWVGTVWFASKFFMYFADGSIYSSTDGLSWTSEVSPTLSAMTNNPSMGPCVRKVKVVNGILFGFPAVSQAASTFYTPFNYNSSNPKTDTQSSSVWTSTDGKTWTTISLPSTGYWHDAAWNGTTYNIVSWTAVSRNTTLSGSWTNGTLPTFGGNAITICGVESIGGKFIYSARHGYVAYWPYTGYGYAKSNDGATITYTSLGDFINNTDYSQDFAPSLYVFGSTLYVYNPNSTVLTTTDGTTLNSGVTQTTAGDASGQPPYPPYGVGRYITGKEWAFVNSRWYHVQVNTSSNALRTSYTTGTPFTSATYTGGSFNVGWVVSSDTYSGKMDNDSSTIIIAPRDFAQNYSATIQRSKYLISTDNGITWTVGSYPSSGQWSPGTWNGTHFYVFKRISSTDWEFYRSTTGATGTWTLSATLTCPSAATDVPCLIFVNNNLWFFTGNAPLVYAYLYQDGTASLSVSYTSPSIGGFTGFVVNNSKTSAAATMSSYTPLGGVITLLFGANGFSSTYPVSPNGSWGGYYTFSHAWDQYDNLWSVVTNNTTSYIYKNGLSYISSPMPSALADLTFDKTTNKMYCLSTNNLAVSTDMNNWTLSTTTIPATMNNYPAMFVKNSVLVRADSTKGLLKTTAGTYISNTTPITVNNTTKYMRVA